MTGRFDPEVSSGEQLESPVLVVDADHRCVEANETASRLLGLTRAQIVGMRLESLRLPEAHLLVLPRLEGSGRPARPTEASGARRPSAREIEILGLLADGATDADIAARLRLSTATVQTHVRNAKSKLGARTRAQAVALALIGGLIDA